MSSQRTGWRERTGTRQRKSLFVKCWTLCALSFSNHCGQSEYILVVVAEDTIAVVAEDMRHVCPIADLSKKPKQVHSNGSVLRVCLCREFPTEDAYFALMLLSQVQETLGHMHKAYTSAEAAAHVATTKGAFEKGFLLQPTILVRLSLPRRVALA